MGALWGSVTRGAGNLTGMIGELIANEWLNSERVGQKVYSHDLELDGITYDVKSKRCSSEPKPEYLASVFAKKDGSVGIKADRLLFARVLDDYSAVTRVVMGCAILLDPRNNIVDPDKDTIDLHPDILRAREATTPRPRLEWREHMGDVLWWKFPIEEPPYLGNPLDTDWPYFTPLIVPTQPTPEAGE